ncbi:PAS domain-containing protein [Mucilaginibacter terrenus]|uniref:histidine kinase n=1 Tax=Mucilaginibacter terrenus TaxID=2482727 RepID=A0A3E2NXE0_9SPHI|nr:PAS domain-containing protein [Mucilaginibacter terrenus]RFZ85685.1 PAS domain-containing protein [Mucilaginibacter terrenus]
MPTSPASLLQQFFDKGPPMVLLEANAPSFRIVAANAAFLSITSTTYEGVVGKDLCSAFPEQLAPSGSKEGTMLLRNFTTVTETRTAQELNGLRYDRSGAAGDSEAHYWRINTSPIIDDDNYVSHLLCEVTDITDSWTLAGVESSRKAFSEQLQHQFMKAPIGMMFINQENYGIEYANVAMHQLLNRAPAEKIIGEPLFKLLPELEHQGYKPLFDEVFATGQSYSAIEAPLQYKRGDKAKTYYIDLTVEPLYDDAGQIRGVVGFALDATDKVRSRARLQGIIDEKKIVESNLRANEKRLVQILETMAEGVSIIDTSGKLTYANPMAQQILGMHENEVLSHSTTHSSWQILKPDGSPLPDEEHPMAMMMATGKPVYDREIAVQPPDGDRFYISINAAPIRDDNNNIVLGIGTFMDVTSRRKIAEQKDEFISVASHELKTPLTSLKLSMQLLTKVLGTDPTSPRIPLFLEKANDNLVRLVHLTEDLMNVSRMDHGKLPLKKTWFNLLKLIEEGTEHIRNNNYNQIILNCDPNLMVYADEHRIDQVVVNFVNNAVKYAPDSKDIIIKVMCNSTEVRVSVQDFGIGIPPEKIPHLFERYYRVDQSAMQFSGLGLGLYISGEIITRHGGKIGVESETGKGSTFWFTLPLS